MSSVVTLSDRIKGPPHYHNLISTINMCHEYIKSMQKRTVWCNILEHRMGMKLNLYGNDALRCFGVGFFFFCL